MSLPLKGVKRRKHVALICIGVGVGCIFISTALFLLIFGHIIREEVIYDVKQIIAKRQGSQPVPTVIPVNTRFGIVIPKIGANAPIIADVDPFTESAYQVALTKGISHAKGSAYPEHSNTGSVFLFAHSAVNFYEANRYNAIFYLLNKIERKDPIYVYYQDKKYTYLVSETKIVDADEVHFMGDKSNAAQLVLMTCWPAGTSLQRLLVIATLQ